MSVAAVRRVVSRLEPGGSPTDAELVHAIAPTGTNREAAFAELVSRHGSMVLGVCRGVLADAHAAEDAFQAVFLVLARKANTIRPPGAVGGWLYGVAVRTARKAKTAAARRQRREMAAIVSANPDQARAGREVVSELDRSELRAIIDAELAALPETHRAAIVLCDLQGKTRSEAAIELNRAEGTVAAWLARGRKALAARLARRGVALPAAGLVAVATPSLVSAELVSTAVGSFAGRGTSDSVLALAEGVMRSLSSVSTKLVGAAFAVGALLAAVATAPAWYAPPEPTVSPDAAPVAASRDDPPPKLAPSAWKEAEVLELTGWLGGSVAYSADGKVLFVGGTDGHVYAYDVATWKKLWEYRGAGHFAALALAPDGKQLAVTTKDGALFLDAVSGKAGDELKREGNTPHAVAFFPDAPIFDDGQLVATNRKVIFGDARGATVKNWLKWPNVSTITMSALPAGKQPADPYAIPLAVSPDGKRVVVTGPLDKDSGKNVLWAWAAGSGAGNELLPGHKATVVSAAWSIDGKWIVTGDADGIVIVWDAAKFKEKSRVALGGRVAAVAVSSDGKHTAAAVVQPQERKGKESYSEDVFVWPTTSPPKKPEPISSHPAGGPFAGIASLAFDPDGKSLVSAFANFDHLTKLAELTGKARVFALAPEKPEPPAPTAKHITDVSFSPDGKRFVTVTMNAVNVHDTATQKILWTVSGEAAGYSADSKTLFVMADKVLECDAETGKVVKSADRPKTKLAARSVRFGPDGKRYAAHFGFTAGVYDTATGSEPVRLDEQFAPVAALLGQPGRGLTFSADGKKLAVVGVLVTENGQMGAGVWDTVTGKRLQGFGSAIVDSALVAAFTPAGDAVAVAFKDRIEVWVLDGDTKKNPVRTIQTAGRPTALAYSKDGKRIAVAISRSVGTPQASGAKSEVQLLNATTGEELKRLSGFEDAKGSSLVITALAFNPDGTKLVAGTGVPLIEWTGRSAVPISGEVKVFDLTAPEKPAPVPGAEQKWTDTAVLTDHTSLVNGVAIAPDGKSFAAATDGNVTCWDSATRKALWTYKPPNGSSPVRALAFSPDSKHLCVAGPIDVKRLDAATGKWAEWYDQNEIVIRFGKMPALGYHPEGKRLAASDGYITKVQRLAQESAEVSIGERPKPNEVRPILPAGTAWSKDGTLLALVRHKQGKSTIVLWEPGRGEPEAELIGHAERITCVAWSKDGTVIASGDEAGTVILWDAETRKELWRKRYGDGAGRVHALALSPEDNTVAVAANLGARKSPERVVLLAAKDGGEVRHLVGPGELPVSSLAWSGDGTFLVTGCGIPPGRAVGRTAPVGEVVVWERKP